MHGKDSFEYAKLIRLEPGRAAPSGFTLISTSAPAVIQQLCRTLTFARGLTLYESWDDWTKTAVGYMVPSFIADIASDYKEGLSVDRWNCLPLHQRSILKHARTLLLDRFPKMPDIAMLRVAERAQRERWNGDKRKLEDRVVNFVRHEWSSYEVRLDHFGRHPGVLGDTTINDKQRVMSLKRKKDEVLEIVKPRMREVLVFWLALDISGSDLAQFYRRHRLYDSAEGIGGYQEANAVIRTSRLQHLGGLETPANLLLKTEVII